MTSKSLGLCDLIDNTDKVSADDK